MGAEVLEGGVWFSPLLLFKYPAEVVVHLFDALLKPILARLSIDTPRTLIDTPRTCANVLIDTPRKCVSIVTARLSA